MNALAKAIIGFAKKNHLRLSCAESVTGGRVVSALTSVSGASEVFYSGIVSYDIESKIRFLDIPKDFFETHSVYSLDCAEKMAENWRKKCDVDFCISTTGQAEGSGEIFFGLSGREGAASSLKIFDGTRNAVQAQAAQYALEILLLEMEKQNVNTELTEG